MTALATLAPDFMNPLDCIEEMASTRDWTLDRVGWHELNMLVEGEFCPLRLMINWRDDFETLHLACLFDLKVPSARRADVGQLLGLINSQLLHGHFDLWQDDGAILFRNNLVLAGGALINEHQGEALILYAISSCERYFPAFQYVIWAGQAPALALAACLFETRGRA